MISDMDDKVYYVSIEKNCKFSTSQIKRRGTINMNKMQLNQEGGKMIDLSSYQILQTYDYGIKATRKTDNIFMNHRLYIIRTIELDENGKSIDLFQSYKEVLAKGLEVKSVNQAWVGGLSMPKSQVINTPSLENGLDQMGDQSRLCV